MDKCKKCGRSMEEHPVPTSALRLRWSRGEYKVLEDIPPEGWHCEYFQDPDFGLPDVIEPETLVDDSQAHLAMELPSDWPGKRSPLHGLPVGGATDAAYEDQRVIAWGPLGVPVTLGEFRARCAEYEKAKEFSIVGKPLSSGPLMSAPKAYDQPWGTIEARWAEIERVQPAIQRAWTAWEYQWGPQRWYRDDSHVDGGYFRTAPDAGPLAEYPS